MSNCTGVCAGESLAQLVIGIGFAIAIAAGLLAWLLAWAVAQFEGGMEEFERAIADMPPPGVRVVLSLAASGPSVAANVAECRRIEEALIEGGVLPRDVALRYTTAPGMSGVTFNYEDRS